MSSLVDLAQQLLDNAKKIEAHVSSQGLGKLSLEHDVLADLPAAQETVRMEILSQAHRLRQLVAGPVVMGLELLHRATDITALRVIYTYGMIHHVPLEGSATYLEISKGCGLREDLVRRFIRHGMANNLFMEKEPERISHSSVTRLMVQDSDFEDCVGLMSCELGPSTMQLPEAFAKWPNSEEANETAYTLNWTMRDGGKQRTLYEFLSENPERSRRFGAAMKFLSKGDAMNVKHLTGGGFDWTAFDRPGSMLVDIGGGHGAVVQHLARQTRNMKFIVQDLATTVKNARALLPLQFKDRIEFQEHDFFTSQPIIDADIYFFRWIFHNINETNCIKILQALFPAMRNGVKVVVFEMVVPDHVASSLDEKFLFDTDIEMQTLFNARERDEQAWRGLFQSASKNFRFKGITTPPGSSFSIIEHEWHDNGDK